MRIAAVIIAGIFGAIWSLSAAMHFYFDSILKLAGWPEHDPWWGFAGAFTTGALSIIGGGFLAAGLTALVARPRFDK